VKVRPQGRRGSAALHQGRAELPLSPIFRHTRMAWDQSHRQPQNLLAATLERPTPKYKNKRTRKNGGACRRFLFRVPRSELKLRFRLGLPQTRNAVPILPLTAFLEQFRALKTLEHIPFAAQCGSRAQTPML